MTELECIDNITEIMYLKSKNLIKSVNRSVKRLGRPLKPLILKIDRYAGGKLSSYLGVSIEEKRIEYSPEERQRRIGDIVRQTRLPIPNERDLKRVEIVVLKYKDPEIETKTAQFLIENTQWPYKLNFYDNRPGTRNMSKIWNILIRESTCDYILIMDSDVFVPKLDPCWLTRLMETFDQKEDCLVVSPKVTKTSCVQQRGSEPEDKGPERFHEPFAGMCTLYKKEAFDKVGFFDEDFLLYGSDTEWAFRFLKLHGGAYLRPDVVVEHYSHYSTRKAAKASEYDASIEREFAADLYKKRTSQ